jgi:nucleoid DNA-binding protein
MEMPSTDVLMRTFREVAVERLKQGGPVPLPGIGTLRVHHEQSRSRVTSGGTQELLPPRDVVLFEPEQPT